MTRRDAQAAETRRVILRAARRLFAAEGYRATKIADIAAEAGVSPQTIYNSVGSKAALLTNIVGSMEDEVEVGEILAEYDAATEPAELVSILMRLARRFVERTGDIVRALSHGASEPELLELRETRRAHHRDGCRMLIERLRHLDALKPGADPSRLADVAAVFSDADMLVLLVDTYGWGLDDAVGYIQRMLERELLA